MKPETDDLFNLIDLYQKTFDQGLGYEIEASPWLTMASIMPQPIL